MGHQSPQTTNSFSATSNTRWNINVLFPVPCTNIKGIKEIFLGFNRLMIAISQYALEPDVLQSCVHGLFSCHRWNFEGKCWLQYAGKKLLGIVDTGCLKKNLSLIFFSHTALKKYLYDNNGVVVGQRFIHLQFENIILWVVKVKLWKLCTPL